MSWHRWKKNCGKCNKAIYASEVIQLYGRNILIAASQLLHCGVAGADGDCEVAYFNGSAFYTVQNSICKLSQS